MTNPNQVRQFMASRRISPWSLSDVVIDAIVAWGMTCASAEVERRRVAEAEIKALRADLELVQRKRTALGDKLQALLRVAKVESAK